MLLFGIILYCIQSIDEINDTLNAAVDKASYEEGAYSAARQLSEMRSREAMSIRIELFDKKYETYRGVYLRDWFYSGYCNATEDYEAEMMLEAARDKSQSEWHRVILLRGLERSKAKANIKDLLNKSFLKNEDVKWAWQKLVTLLWREGRILWGEESENTLLKFLENAGRPYLHYTNLNKIEPKQVDKLFKEFNRSKNPQEKGLMIYSLTKHASDDPRYANLIKDIFNSIDAGPKSIILKEIAVKKVYSAVPQLINILSELSENIEEPGKFIDQISETLRNMTGQPFGPSAKIWGEWWQNFGEEWLKTPSESTTENNVSKDTTKAQFFGIPIKSNNLMILIDGSGSMNDKLSSDLTSAETAIREVSKLLEQLPKKVMFQIGVIESEIILGFKGKVNNSPRNQKKAKEFFEKRPYQSTSALFDSLITATNDPSTDTILIVSDGGSSAGKHQYSGHLLDATKRLIERTGVRIHCVLVTKSKKHQKFLADLAAISDGKIVSP